MVLRKLLLGFAVLIFSVSVCRAEENGKSVGRIIEITGETFEALPQNYAAPIKELIGNIDEKFTIAAFIKKDCEDCEIGLSLFRDFARMYPNLITIAVYDKKDERRFRDKFNIDFYPSFIFLDADGKDRGVKFVGAPKGYSLNTVVSAVRLFGNGKSDITDEQREMLKKVTQESLIEVIITPGCPHCPRASIIANSVAYENDFIKTRTVDATQYADLAKKYNVRAVPLVVYNQKTKEIGVNRVERIVENLLK